MRDLSKVCHLGFLDTEAPAKLDRRSGNSLEGSGLSVSVTPMAWRKIARLGGSDSYILTKESPRFADGLDEETQKEA